MNLRQIRDSFRYIDVWHATRNYKTAFFLEDGEFEPGKGSGSMLGRGVYANIRLEQTIHYGLKNYGEFIVHFKVPIDNMFVANPILYHRFYPTMNTKTFIEDQVSKFNLPRLPSYPKNFKGRYRLDIGSSYSKRIWKTIQNHGLDGIIYHGSLDKDSLVCYKPELVKVVEWKYKNSRWFSMDMPLEEVQNIPENTLLDKLSAKMKGEVKQRIISPKAIPSDAPVADKVYERAGDQIISIDLSMVRDAVVVDFSKLPLDYNRKIVINPGFSYFEKVFLKFNNESFSKLVIDSLIRGWEGTPGSIKVLKIKTLWQAMYMNQLKDVEIDRFVVMYPRAKDFVTSGGLRFPNVKEVALGFMSNEQFAVNSEEFKRSVSIGGFKLENQIDREAAANARREAKLHFLRLVQTMFPNADVRLTVRSKGDEDETFNGVAYETLVDDVVVVKR